MFNKTDSASETDDISTGCIFNWILSIRYGTKKASAYKTEITIKITFVLENASARLLYYDYNLKEVEFEEDQLFELDLDNVIAGVPEEFAREKLSELDQMMNEQKQTEEITESKQK